MHVVWNTYFIKNCSVKGERCSVHCKHKGNTEAQRNGVNSQPAGISRRPINMIFIIVIICIDHF